MADTVPAMLEPGEYVIRKDAAEEIGIDNLDMLNNVDRSSQMYMNHGGLVPQLQHGHSAIDELLAINTLSNQANVDMTRQSSMMNQVEATQDNTMSNLMNSLTLKEISDKSPQLSMYDADTRGGVRGQDDPLGIYEGNFIPAAGILNKGYAGIFGSGDVSLSKIKKLLMSEKFNEGKKGGMLRQLQKQSPAIRDFMTNWPRSGNEKLADKYAKMLVKEAKDVYKKGYQDGGKVPQAPDPLQIDARMRGEFGDMGTIGAVDSNKYYSNLLNEAMQDKEMLEKASFLEGYAPSEEKIKQDIFKALDYFSRKHKASPKVQGYNNGGQVYSYGSQTTEIPTLEEAQRLTGQRIDDPEGAGLQEYDLSREEGVTSDFNRQIASMQSQLKDMQMTGGAKIGQAITQANTMGGGFEDFGGRQTAIDTATTQAQRGYESGIGRFQSGLDQAKQDKFESIRSMREGFLTDQITNIGLEESKEGTSDYNIEDDPNWNAPENPIENQQYVFNNQVYKYTNGSWKKY